MTKYMVNKAGGIHSVPDEYVFLLGEREATGEEKSAYQAAFEDHSNDPARQWPPLLPDVPTHNPPPAPAVLPGPDNSVVPSAPPPGTPIADTKPQPPDWARDNPRVIAGQQAIPSAPAAGSSGPVGADGTPTGAGASGGVEDGPIPVAVDLTGAPHPVYTDPAQRTEDAGLPAGTYPPNTTDVGLSVPDAEGQVVTNDAASVKAQKASKSAGPSGPMTGTGSGTSTVS